MPKTKRPKKSRAESQEKRVDKNDPLSSMELTRLNSKLEDFKNAEAKLRDDFEDQVIGEIKRQYAILKMRIPESVGNSEPRSPVRHSETGLATAVRGMTVSPAAGPPQSSHTKTSTKVAEPPKRGRSTTVSSALAKTAHKFRTPNCNMATGMFRSRRSSSVPSFPSVQYSVITPKVSADVPLTIVRRPREGEVAFALTGSPLLVSNAGSNETANVIVPLTDGRVMSILPQAGLRREDMPEVDSHTMRQLLRLRDNIDLFLKNK